MKIYIKHFTILLFSLMLSLFTASFAFADLFGLKGLNELGRMFKSPPTYKAFVLRPSQVDLTTIKKLAILEFDGNSGGYNVAGTVSDELTHILLSKYGGVDAKEIYMNGAFTNVYELVDRSELDHLLSEQKFSISGAVDDNQAVEIGKILGLDAIVIGSSSYNVDTDSKYHRSDNGNYYTYERKVNVTARMKIIDIKTAKILGSTSESSNLMDTADKRNELVNESNMLASAASNVALKLHAYMSPHFQQVGFYLDKVKIRALSKRAKEARKLVRRGQLAKSFQIYNAIYEEDSYNPKVAYNAATLYEVSGDFNKAFELYSLAAELDPDSKKYHEGVDRVKANIDAMQLYKLYGMNITSKFNANRGSNLLAEKIKVKGKSSTRTKIYAQPNESSKVMAKIPGGLNLTILEDLDNWYKVKLVGNKQGYISKKNASPQ